MSPALADRFFVSWAQIFQSWELNIFGTYESGWRGEAKNWREWIPYLFKKLEFWYDLCHLQSLFTGSLPLPTLDWNFLISWREQTESRRTSREWEYCAENRRENKWKLRHWRRDLQTSSQAEPLECWQLGRHPPSRMDWLPPGRKICKVKEESNRYWCQGWLKELAQSELLKVKATLDKTDTCIPSFQSSFWLCILTTKEKSVSYEKSKPTGKSYLKVTERLSREKKISKNSQIIRGLREDKVHACLGAQLLQLCPTLKWSYGLQPTRLCFHGILQARILEWVAMLSSRGSSQPRGRTRVSCISWRLFYPLSNLRSPKILY